ncbi:MAG: ABC transporter permease [Acidimicrobiia bacterium]
MGLRFWLRWSWRDLRRRAPQVLAIATIIALGAGVYAGLGTTSVWRRASLDATFSGLSAHDVRVSLVNGLSIDRDTLVTAIEGAAGHDIARVETRVIAFAPVTATHGSTAIPAAGEIVGIDLNDGRRIDRWRVTAGRDLAPTDSAVALLDAHFARQHNLPEKGTIRIGNLTVSYVGLALSPAYLNLNTTSGEAIQGQATRAVVFMPQQLARKIAGVSEPLVNDAAIRLRAGADAQRTASELQRVLATSLPGVALTATARRDEPAVRALYDEISSEQQLFDLFALLILAGAGFAAFNLTKRVVEAQRRDIGIAMSLGLPPRKIAIRTMLLAAEITVVGVALGIGTGWAIATWVLSVMRDRVPLPIWETPFQPGLFLRGALLGLVVPLVASAIPVWRAVRVQPVDALLPAHLRGGGHRLARLLRRLRLPGTIAMQTPLRRIVRAPARSALTIAAIAFIMAPLLAALGATDSARATIDSGERTLTGSGDRLLIDLTAYQPSTSALVERIGRLPRVQRAEPGLNTGGYLLRGDKKIGISLSMGDLRSGLSVPASIAARHLPPGGIVISRKAADDLGVGVGDPVTLRHPLRVGTGFRFADTELPVTAIHTSPYRFVAYMDLDDEKIMGLDNIVNTMKVLPRPGVSMSELQQRIAAMPGVASALPASSLSRMMRDLLSVVGNLFVILQIVIAGLAFLVAFNASNIGAEERSREHATMLAFGVKVRQVAFMSFAESMVLGIIGVGLGLALGVAVLRWILDSVFPVAVPDLAVLEFLSTPSYLLTIAIGLAAAAAAPWLNVRRLRAMNLPNTLRYVE